MTKKAYRKLVISYLQWSVIGLIVALTIAFVSSDHRSVVYGVPGVGSVDEVTVAAPASSTYSAPATAPEKVPEAVIPDTVNGVLIWPDPWDQIQ